MPQSNVRWWETAITRQVLVPYFFDSNGDGWGDIPGVTSHLKYFTDDEVDSLWFHPLFAGPMRDFTYDVSDYYQLNPRFGTIRQFKTMVKKAHSRNIRIIIDVPLNHTSADHQWFLAAIDPTHPDHEKYRDWYLFSDTAEEYAGAAVLFKDFESSNWTRVRDLAERLGWGEEFVERLGPMADKFYFHRFFFHQPDLNHDNPGVREEVQRIIDFLYSLGVDMVRLDAGPHFIKRDGTNCEGIPETHEYFQWLCGWANEKYPDKGFLIEANRPPEELVEYLNDGNRAGFDFVSMAALYLALMLGNRKAIYDAIVRLRGLGIPLGAVLWLFLALHDEKTWEFLLRSQRHRAWAHYGHGEAWRKQNWGTVGRLANLVQGDRRLWELMWALLYALKGPKLSYYGDELMMGDTSDLPIEPDKGRPEFRNSTRTIYPHGPGKNAGFSTCDPEQLCGPLVKDGQFGYLAVNREFQEAIPTSPLWWKRRLNKLCKEYADLFCTGDIWPLEHDNEAVAVVVRTAPGREGEDILLCVFNLTPDNQPVALDLSQWEGRILTAISAVLGGGQPTEFPLRANSNYPLILGPYEYIYILVEK